MTTSSRLPPITRFEVASEEPPIVRDRQTQEFYLWLRGPEDAVAL